MGKLELGSFYKVVNPLLHFYRVVENPLWIQYCRRELLSPANFCHFKQPVLAITKNWSKKICLVHRMVSSLRSEEADTLTKATTLQLGKPQIRRVFLPNIKLYYISSCVPL